MKCLLLLNPKTGKGKILKKLDFVQKKLSEKFELETCITTSRQDLLDKTKLACQNFDVLVFAGGDGTVNDVLNVVANQKTDLVLGYVPTGTCNDFARSAGISKNIKKALDTICHGTPKFFDGFSVNGRFGAYVCACGIFTTASYDTRQKTKRFLGKLGYYFHSVGDIFKARSMEIEASFDGNAPFKHSSVLFLLANSCSVAGWKFNKHANLHDGKMDFVSIETRKKNKKIGFKALLTVARMFLFGLKSVKKSKLVKVLRFEKAHIKTLTPQTINVDGENGGMGEINFLVHKDLFKMLSN